MKTSIVAKLKFYNTLHFTIFVLEIYVCVGHGMSENILHGNKQLYSIKQCGFGILTEAQFDHSIDTKFFLIVLIYIS